MTNAQFKTDLQNELKGAVQTLGNPVPVTTIEKVENNGVNTVISFCSPLNQKTMNWLQDRFLHGVRFSPDGLKCIVNAPNESNKKNVINITPDPAPVNKFRIMYMVVSFFEACVVIQEGRNVPSDRTLMVVSEEGTFHTMADAEQRMMDMMLEESKNDSPMAFKIETIYAK